MLRISLNNMTFIQISLVYLFVSLLHSLTAKMLLTLFYLVLINLVNRIPYWDLKFAIREGLRNIGIFLIYRRKLKGSRGIQVLPN